MVTMALRRSFHPSPVSGCSDREQHQLRHHWQSSKACVCNHPFCTEIYKDSQAPPTGAVRSSLMELRSSSSGRIISPPPENTDGPRKPMEKTKVVSIGFGSERFGNLNTALCQYRCRMTLTVTLLGFDNAP